MCAAMGCAELKDRLLEFDRAVALTFPGRAFGLVLVGGGAMALLGCLARPTDDLDALRFDAELVPLMEQYDISGRVVAYENHFGYHVDDRVVPLDLETRAVRVFTASLEDIVASKLYSARDTDAVDVRRPEVLAALDWSALDAVAADMTDSRLSDRRHAEFLGTYRAYRKEFGPCDT